MWRAAEEVFDTPLSSKAGEHSIKHSDRFLIKIKSHLYLQVVASGIRCKILVG